MTELRRVTPIASTQLAPNPGPMTLDGTNSYVLRGDADSDADGGRGSGSRTGAVVVDPGPEYAGHLAALAEAGPIDLILITHGHLDHTEGARTLHELTGAPVRALAPAHCHGGAALTDGEHIVAAGVRLTVLATPGHTADSVCFYLPDDGETGSVLTGDTVLGRGSTVIGIPDGTLRQYLDSLQTLAALGRCRGLPAHGPEIDDLSVVCQRYLDHRRERLDQVRAALSRLGVSARNADPDAVVDAVYMDVDPAVRYAARHSVAAQLTYLAEE